MDSWICHLQWFGGVVRLGKVYPRIWSAGVCIGDYTGSRISHGKESEPQRQICICENEKWGPVGTHQCAYHILVCIFIWSMTFEHYSSDLLKQTLVVSYTTPYKSSSIVQYICLMSEYFITNRFFILTN